MNVKQLICARKKDIARKGYKPGRARVMFGGYDRDGRRTFTITISAEPDHLMWVNGSCDINENDVRGTRSTLFNPNEL